MAEIDKDTKDKISNMQLLDQRLQSILLQKQALQSQLLETENALGELKKNASKEAYKIIGGIMISVSPLALTKELESNVESIGLRVKNIEKQEVKLRKDISDIQEEVISKIKK